MKSKKQMKAIKAKYHLIAAGIVLIGIVAVAYLYFLSSFSASETQQYVYIDDDDTADSVYARLAPIATSHGMRGLTTLLRHAGYEQNVRTGRFAIDPDDNVLSVFRRLKNGQQTPLMLTIPESRTMPILAGALGRKLMIDSTTIVRALTSQDFCQQMGYDTTTIACLFVPNTYEVYWNTSLESFVKRMQKEHEAFWNNGRRHKAEQIGMSVNEVCTLASIIDEETSNNSEKPMIAGMYINRLKADMPLQADPTVKFALQDFGLRRIYNNMLRTNSPYNTYRNTGLPPGPIKIASVKGIDAVLGYVAHDYLYMCAKEDFSGTHNFARTYQEHLQNAARYSKALNEKNIK